MTRPGSTLLLLLLLTTPAFAAGPFIGDEERIATTRLATDLTIVRSSDATLVAWIEGSQVRAHANGTTRTLGTGTDVRAATDGRDFQIIWVEGNRIAGARWSNPSDVQTLVNLDSFNPAPRKPPAVVWNGSGFEIFSGSVDAAAAMPGLVVTARSTSVLARTICIRPPFSSFICREEPATYRIDVNLRAGDASRSFTTTQVGFSSVHAPSVAAGGEEALLVWKSPIGIDGFRIRRDGSTAGFVTVPISRSMTGKRGPQVAWDGTRYLIVFDVVDASGDIWGAVVTPGPTYIAEPFVIARSAENELAPAVTALGPDRFVVAYSVGNDAIAMREISFREPLPSRRRAAR